MSSIYGVFSKQQTTEPYIKNMMTAANYWSPDNETYWTSKQGHIAMAKSLLKISDPNEDVSVGLSSTKIDKLRITANARLDNRKSLLNTIYGKGTSPNYSDSDTILAAYQRWGKACVNHLKGDFAFVIWDEEAESFFCARDHFGVKVLFYSLQESGLMLTNEHGAFFTSGWCDATEFDEEKIVANLWSISPTEFTSPNPNINVFPPAHTLEFNTRDYKLKIERYWELKPNRKYGNFSDDVFLSEFNRLFKQAVTRRLDTSYEIGTELSEGLDSSSIAGVAATKLSPKKLYTFSYDCIKSQGPHDIWNSVYNDICSMFKFHKNLTPIWLEGGDKTKFEIVNDFKMTFYESFFGVVPLAGERFQKAKLAKDNNIRVMLSGWGGDQCVTSSASNYNDELLRNFKLSTLYKHLVNQRNKRNAPRPSRIFLSLVLKHLLPSIYGVLKRQQRRALHSKLKTHFLKDEFVERLQTNPYTDLNFDESLLFSVREKEYAALFKKGLTKNLIEIELTGKKFQVEYRFPMLDIDLVELAYSMPAHLKQFEGVERYPIRKVMKGLAPEKTRWRRKSDVTSPRTVRSKEIEKYASILRTGLNENQFAKRYSTSQKLATSLNNLDPFLIRQLQYLIHMSEHYKHIKN